VLELGNPAQIDPSSFLSRLGFDKIAVIVNQDNNLSQLSINMLQSIYSGQLASWEINSSQPIAVWVLPDGDPVRADFDRVLMQSISLTSDAMLAPNPVAMLEAVAGDSNAIGYLPGSVLTLGDPKLVSKVKTIQLDETVEEDLKQPVIALTKNEPQGLLREILSCVENLSP
jgi:ABC-type phosphate transport system substrate-binding protein